MNNKRGRGGFTLVELIVVLVILAILAALLIPALTGYIDKSKKSQVIAETRMLHQAIQAEISDHYGSSQWGNWGVSASGSVKPIASNRAGSESSVTERYNKILSLAEVPSLENASGAFYAYVNESGQVSLVVYKDGKGKVGIYFSDTGETLAYAESDFSSDFNSYFDAIKGTVSFTPKYDYGTHLNPLTTKETLLQIFGYTGS